MVPWEIGTLQRGQVTCVLDVGASRRLESVVFTEKCRKTESRISVGQNRNQKSGV